MNKKVILVLIIVVLIVAGAVGGYFIYKKNKNNQKSSEQQNMNMPQESQTSPAPNTEQTASTQVKIINYKFDPDTIKIKKGTTVTWTNNDSVVHTVTSDNGVFDSGSMAKNQSFSFTFNQVGEFLYHCRPHPYMKAKVIVE